MKAATLFIIAIVSIWFADALPFPPLPPLPGRGGERGHIQSPDGPYFTYGRQMQQDEVKMTEDEEEVDRKIGLSKRPNVIGDMVLTPEQMEQLEGGGGEGNAQAFYLEAQPWPSAVFPYRFDESLDFWAIYEIIYAMYELSTRSCIQFVEVTSSNSHQYQSHVVFFAGDGCWSYLGMLGGVQPVSIGRGCEYKGIIQHEIFHALGRVHEQSRPDRDQYVTINFHNVEQGLEGNFQITPSDTQNLPYDYGSIMHYGQSDFSIRYGDPNYYTIVPKQPGVEIGQRVGLSETDWNHLNKAYCSKATALNAVV